MEKERKLIDGGKPRMADHAYTGTNKPTAHLPNLHNTHELILTEDELTKRT